MVEKEEFPVVFTTNGLRFLGVFVVIMLIIFLIKCCMAIQKGPKKTRGRRRRTSYQHFVETTIPTTSASRNRPQSVSGHDDGYLLIEETVDAASPVVVPPYPVEPRHPTPQTMPPGPGFATHNPPYPAHNPHPVGGAAPYPPVSATAPYPPVGPIGGIAPYSDQSAQPPSYSEAVSQPPMQPPLLTKEGYTKPAPYNPNY